ncbi:MAG: galactose-1-phosphate uridylyltransferase [Acidothermus cellulolyticus]|nr:galactose-1-phosphate uridylyltransferase [Acidothermus cellulolyticus]
MVGQQAAGDGGGTDTVHEHDGPNAASRRPVVPIVTQLADGREIRYYDDPGVPIDHGDLVDHRELPPMTPTSIRRFDRLLDEWVTIAGHRQSRTYLPPDDECPLCPSKQGRQSEIPARDYHVVVFENRFPSFTTTARVPSDGDGFFVTEPGLGRCEVVCFTSDHTAAFSSLPVARVRTVIDAWIDRTLELSQLPYVEQVFCFENRGSEIGVTLSHPHGQIYGYPFVTPRTRRMLDSARAHHERTGRNLFADIVAAEVAAGTRIIAGNAHWVAFVPYAARWPLEVHLYPRRRVPDLPALNDAERDALAPIYLEVVRRMEHVYPDTMPYIAAWHQAPVRVGRELAYLHLELFSIRRAPGKLKFLAGSESAMGAFINDVLPEEAADMLRTVSIDPS